MNKISEQIELILQQAEASRGITPERLLLGSNNVPPANRADVALQLSLRSKLKQKLPDWAALPCYIPSKLALEQCSSQDIARYKQRFVRPQDIVADLTAGLGVDYWALSSASEQKSYYIEKQADLVEAARYNIPKLCSKDQTFIESQAEQQLLPLVEKGVNLFYIDPARRAGTNGGQQYFRKYGIEDCRPNLLELIPSLPPNANIRLLAKLSPMLDISDTINKLEGIAELHILAQRNEVKELLALIEIGSSHPKNRLPIFVVDVANEMKFSFTMEQETHSKLSISGTPGHYIHIPHPALMKAGCFALLSERFEIWQLHVNSHIYSSDHLVEGFLGRSFRVESIFPYHRKEIKTLQKRLSAANISCRNFPLSTANLRAKLNLKEANEPHLIATTLADESLALLLCQEI